MMFFDMEYLIIMAPVFIFSLGAQWMVKSRYKKFAQYSLSSGQTGAEIARQILRANRINDVAVEETGGWLSDHYSPTEKVLRLSSDVYNGRSISSAGIAAHETGHAIQHASGYAIMNLWQMLAKPATFASNFAVWALMIGFFMDMFGLIQLGILLFAFIVLFQLVTLPVEFNASSRAKSLLSQYNIIHGQEYAAVGSVLNAAAMTYVAAAAASIAQLLYFLMRAGFLGGRDD